MTETRNIDWDAVASYYDAYVQTQLDVPFFLEQSRRGLVDSGGAILELMCGTGRLTLPLAQAGYEVTAIDSSAGLLARLRAKLVGRDDLRVRVVEADARDFHVGGSFPLVIVGFHAFAELLGRDARRRSLARIREHTAAHGRFVLTLHNPTVRARAVHAEWRSMGTFALDRATRLEVASRWEVDMTVGRVLGAQRYRELDGAGACRRELSVPIVFDLVTQGEVSELADEAGFQIVARWGDYAGNPFDETSSPFMIFSMSPR